jgi:hypothetical protein
MEKGLLASEIPHFTHTTCLGSVFTPHAGQNFFSDLGLNPHFVQATAFSFTSFPQFLQYIVSIF